MKKQLLASLLSLFLVAGLAPIAAAGTTACCAGSSDCVMDKSPACPYKVLTKEECNRYCKAKAAAIAKDPSLAKPENRCKLNRTIVKEDPSMKPICMKLRKECRKMMKKHCMNSACDKTPREIMSEQSSSTSSSPQDASPQANSTSSSSMNNAVASHSASAESTQTEESTQTQSSGAASVN